MILFWLVTNPSDEMSAVFTQKSPCQRQWKINPFPHCCQDRTELLCSSARIRLAEKKEMIVEVLPNAYLEGRDPCEADHTLCDKLKKT